MKLKYYLRGLATGLVIATLILTIANRDNKPLTDAQIRQRAAEMGMIDGDSLKLSALQGSAPQAEPSSTAESDSPADSGSAAESGTVAESGSVAESSAAVESGSTSSEPSGSAESSSVAEPSSTTEPGGTTEPGSSVEPGSSETPSQPASTDGAVTIVISGGATSYTVSKDLAAAGLVEDAKEYDAFLCDNGYAHTIRVGTYEILPGTSGEEIAKMIAR